MNKSASDVDFVAAVRQAASEASSAISGASRHRSRRCGSEVDLRSRASSKRSYGSSYASSAAYSEKAMTLQEQQQAVQDAAYERYISNLQKDAKQAVCEANTWKMTVKTGLDEDINEKVRRKHMYQQNQCQLQQQIEHNKERRAEGRREYIESASSHSFPLFTETYISLPEVEEYERQRKIRWREELDQQKKVNDMLRNIELKAFQDASHERNATNIKTMRRDRGSERERLAMQGKDLVRNWDRDVRLKDIKKAIHSGKDVVQDLDISSRRRM